MKYAINLLFVLITLPLATSAQSADIPQPNASDMSLEQSVAEGLLNNVELIAAKMGISVAQADEMTAGLWPNPTLQLDAGLEPFGKNWDQTNSGGPKQTDIILSFPLDLSGKRSAARKSAHEATEMATATFQDAVRQKVLQIRLAYFDILSAQQQSQLAQDKERDLRKLVQIAEGKIGQKTRLPLFQRRAGLARQQAVLDSLQKQIMLRAALTNLTILLGKNDGALAIRASSGLRDFKYLEMPALKELTETALQDRPDLKALKLAEKKADLDKTLAHRQVWDDFNLAAGFTTQGPTTANPDDSSSRGLGVAHAWSVALQIPLPTFNRNQGNIQKASFLFEQSAHQIRSLELSIRQEIAGLYDQIKMNRTLIEDYESSQLDSARKIHDAEQVSLGSGGSTLLEYLDAMSAYYGTLGSYSDALSEYRRNMARLDAALGAVK